METQFSRSTMRFMARPKRYKRSRPCFLEKEVQGEQEQQQLAAYTLMMISHAYGMTFAPAPRLSFPSKRKSEWLLEGFDFEADFTEMPGLKEENEKKRNARACRKRKLFSLEALDRKRESINNISKSLQGHKEVASSSTKEKIHKCLICGRGFTSGRALGGHKSAHTRYRSIDATSRPQAFF
ncbi:hypothetical protein SUGI_0692320 [Cryptomeria japonica]|uniref:uncharacterized protein LOC131856528 n=1 Tax=Cryptomeria japonica TaxID=3369 RepID=UPI002414B71A|nr:uncharacterized protein LOC131856528 [Cryptomeria japonica]GLJ34431.1 hypothetical protein SUGI_0692320 [Cryptomeria japonica]